MHEDIVQASETAGLIVSNPKYLTFLRSVKSQTQEDLARDTKVEIEVIKHIESGTFDYRIDSLMEIAKSYNIPPKDIDEEYMYDDPDGPRRYGKIDDRDRRYGKPKDYWRWFHRRIKPHLRGTDSDKLNKSDHDEYERQWQEAGCPLPKQLTRKI